LPSPRILLLLKIRKDKTTVEKGVSQGFMKPYLPKDAALVGNFPCYYCIRFWLVPSPAPYHTVLVVPLRLREVEVEEITPDKTRQTLPDHHQSTSELATGAAPV